MDFIERLLGVAPDGGSGTLEMVILLVPVIVMWIFAARWRGSARV
jgi:hypothetical protein